MATYPTALYSETDVAPGEKLGTSTPMHRPRYNALKNEVVAIETIHGIDPHVVNDAVTVTSTPATTKEKTDVLATRIKELIGTFTGTVSLSQVALVALFDNATGHNHDGSAGKGGQISHDDLADLTTGNPHPQYNPMTTQDDIIIGGASGVAARLAKGANGTFLGVNGSGHLAYGTPSGGGGGAGTITIEELDGTPTGAFDTLKFPNGTLTDNGDGSATYTPAGGGGGGSSPYTPPGSTTGWAWQNQDGATLTANADAWDMTTDTADGEVHPFYEAYPTPPFTMIAGIMPPLLGTNYISAGIGFQQGTGNMYLFYVGYQDGFWYVRVDQWDNPASFHARQFSAVTFGRDVMLLKIEDDNTDVKFSVAHDLSGNWQQVYQDARTAWVAAADRLSYFMQGSTGVAGHSRLVHLDIS